MESTSEMQLPKVDKDASLQRSRERTEARFAQLVSVGTSAHHWEMSSLMLQLNQNNHSTESLSSTDTAA